MANLIQQKKTAIAAIAIGASALVGPRNIEAAQDQTDIAGPSSSSVKVKTRDQDGRDKSHKEDDAFKELAGPSVTSSGPVVRRLDTGGDAGRVTVLERTAGESRLVPELHGPYNTEIRAHVFGFSRHISILVNAHDVSRVMTYLESNFSADKLGYSKGFEYFDSRSLDTEYAIDLNATVVYRDRRNREQTMVTPHSQFLRNFADLWAKLDDRGILLARDFTDIHYQETSSRERSNQPSRGTIDRVIIKGVEGEVLSGIYRSGEEPGRDRLKEVYGRGSSREWEREIEITRTQEELPLATQPGVVHMFAKNGDGATVWIPVHLEYGAFSANFYPLKTVARNLGLTYVGESGWLPSKEREAAQDFESGMSIGFSGSRDYQSRRYVFFGPKDVENTELIRDTVHAPSAADFYAYLNENEIYNVKIERIILPSIATEVGSERPR